MKKMNLSFLADTLKHNLVDLSNLDILVIGQVKTSRTETLEDYLKGRVRYLAVVALGAAYGKMTEARCTFYHKGKRIKEFSIFAFSIKNITRWKYPLIAVTFVLYIFTVLYALLRLGKRFDLAITIATASTFIGCAFLRPLRIIKSIIYYCIDYYPPGANHLGDFLGFQRIFHLFYKQVDTYLIKTADITWEISPRIKEGREQYTRGNSISFNAIIVPLGFSEEFSNKCQSNNKSINDRERWTLGFIGVLSQWQGLTMVIEAMPYLYEQFPDIKVRIIGDGIYSNNLKTLIKHRGLEDRFIFHGYIGRDEEVFDILSRCVVGLATWTGSQSDYSRYADPGKPKLYALLGLPIIMTSAPHISKSIFESGAGEVIEYNVSHFISAVEKIISTDENLKDYIAGVERFKPYCHANDIFDRAFLDTFEQRNSE